MPLLPHRAQIAFPFGDEGSIDCGGGIGECFSQKNTRNGQRFCSPRVWSYEKIDSFVLIVISGRLEKGAGFEASRAAGRSYIALIDISAIAALPTNGAFSLEYRLILKPFQ